MTIAFGMLQGDFIVANDAVVEVSDVECSVEADLQVDRTEPWVF